jgi:competence protein ComGF
MSTKKYTVSIDSFAKSHYLKKINKKYKKAFDSPWKAFEFMLQRFDTMLETSRAKNITDTERESIICKVEFKIMPDESAKKSGNRCIIVRDVRRQEIKILVVYNKGHVQGSNETQWWKQMIKDNYSEYKDLL